MSSFHRKFFSILICCFPAFAGIAPALSFVPGQCNNLLVKLEPEDSLTISSFVLAGAPVACAPFDARFLNTSLNALESIWKINGDSVSSETDLNWLFTESGLYVVELIVRSNLTINGADTSSITLSILSAGGSSWEIPGLITCENEAVMLGSVSADTLQGDISWNFGHLLNDSSLLNPIATVDTTIRFAMQLQRQGCIDTIYQEVRVLKNRSYILDTLRACSAEVVRPGLPGTYLPQADFSWSPAALLDTPYIANPAHTAQADVAFRLIVDLQTCADTFYQALKVHTPVTTSLPDLRICRGDSLQLSVPLAENVLWSPANQLSDAGIPDPVFYADTTELLQIHAGMPGCADTFLLRIVVPGGRLWQLPELRPCYLDSVVLDPAYSPEGVQEYSWLPAEGLSSDTLLNPVLLATRPAEYQLLLRYSEACSDTFMQVVHPRMDEADAGPDITACENVAVQIGAAPLPGYTYLWEPAALLDNPEIPNPFATVDTDTRFYLLRMPPEGSAECPARDSLLVISLSTPKAAMDLKLHPTCDSIRLELKNRSTGTHLHRFRFEDGSTTTGTEVLRSYAYGAEMQIELRAYNGPCADTLLHQEKLKDLDAWVVLNDADAFSPDGDGINDCFSPALKDLPEPYNAAFLPCSYLQIYNRWGNLIFDAGEGDFFRCWDGTSLSGELLPEGVYYYNFRLGEHSKSGKIHLIRD